VRYVFVYGTLRRGEARDINCLLPAPEFVMQAKVFGRLYDLGTYPGLQLGYGNAVVGEVYAISPSLESVLDEIEGIGTESRDEYLKSTVDVSLDGKPCSCLVYEVNPAGLSDKTLIAHGDWVRYRQDTKN
jgi:gamma-glutamylcyclotransferase (GGCT)/AIG2-like uncharacterized protein YtfP